MSLSDAALGHEDDGGDAGAMLKIEPMGLDCKHCAAEIMKAVENKDVNALEDALRMFMAACEEEEDKDGGEEDEGY